MFSSPSLQTSAPPQRRSVISTALRSAGLTRTDGDVSMRDAAGGVKRSARHRPHEKPTRSKRLEKMELDAAASAKVNSTYKPNLQQVSFHHIDTWIHLTTQLAARLKGPSGSVISIRGTVPTASSSSASRMAGGSPTTSRIPRLRNVIVEPSTRASGGAPSVDLLRQVVTRRWDPQTQFLNLERLADDEIMKKHKIPSLESLQAPRQLGPVIFKLAGELKPPCKTISLASNNLTNTHNLASLNHYLPSLNALSLENNKLRAMRDLDGLSHKAAKASLSSITELVLKGNPLRESAVQEGRLDTLRNDISRRFPMLSVLDQEALPRLAFDVEASTVNAAQAQASATAPVLPTPASFPVPVQPNLFIGGVEAISAQFLTQYFTLFDTNRYALEAAYAPHATFSLSANTSIPPRARKRGFQHSTELPNQKSLNWDFFRSASRNLERISAGTSRATPDKAVELLHTGPHAIVAALMRCPATKHDMSKPEKFAVDAFPMVGILHGEGYGTDALFIQVHGEFAEGPSWGIRSFDRSFVLAIASEGSPARSAGWQVMILSDVFVVRAYSSADAWAPGELAMASPPAAPPLSQKPPPPATASSNPPAPGPNRPRQEPANSLAQLQADPLLQAVPDQQKLLLIQLAQQTGLTIRYAGQCLEGNGWDIQRAVANFAQVKDNLPTDAWLRR